MPFFNQGFYSKGQSFTFLSAQSGLRIDWKCEKACGEALKAVFLLIEACRECLPLIMFFYLFAK